MKNYYLLAIVLFFSITSATAQVKDILIFNSTNGSYPHGSLTLSGETLYGMTYTGGRYGDGTIFSVDTGGSRYKDVLDLWGQEYPYGSQAQGTLVLAGNKLYGITSQGGQIITAAYLAWIPVAAITKTCWILITPMAAGHGVQ